MLESTVVDTVSVKNSIIKNVIPMQKSVNDNPRLLNDDDFKFFTENQRQLKTNKKNWNYSQKSRIENEVKSLQECETNLHATKQNKADTRAAMLENLKTLEQKLDETSKECMKRGQKQSEEPS